jgi:hypothetical protein
MKSRNLIPALALIVYLFGVVPLCDARIQGSLSFSGYVKAKGASNTRFTVKLYPPKTSKSPVVLTTTDDSGYFKFTNLSASSYLLEIYFGTELIYQEVIKLSDTVCCEIDLSRNADKRQCPCSRTPR